MTANRNIKGNSGNKKGKKLKRNNIGYIIETLILTAAAVFLSVVGPISLIDPLGLICAVAASVLFACVIFLTGPKIIIPAVAVSFAAAFVAGKDLLGSFSGLAYMIVGALIYFGAKTGKNGTYKRTRITVAIAGFFAIFCTVVFIVSIFLSAGSFSIRAGVNAIDAYLSEGVSLFIDNSPALLQYLNSPEENLIEAYKEEIIVNMRVILPACFIMYNLFAAYLATSVFKSAYNIFIPLANPARKRIKNNYWRVNISVVSAVVLIVSIFSAAVVSELDNPFFAIVLTNLIYILVPGFCVMGIYFAYDKLFKSAPGIFPFFLLFGAVLLAFIFPFAVLASMAVFMMFGLYAALIGDIKKFYEKTKKLLFGDDDDDDDYID